MSFSTETFLQIECCLFVELTRASAHLLCRYALQRPLYPSLRYEYVMCNAGSVIPNLVYPILYVRKRSHYLNRLLPCNATSSDMPLPMWPLRRQIWVTATILLFEYQTFYRPEDFPAPAAPHLVIMAVRHNCRAVGVPC